MWTIFLIITYTRAAAAELRARLASGAGGAGGGDTGGPAPAAADVPRVSGGYQDGGRLLRIAAAGSTSTCWSRWTGGV